MKVDLPITKCVAFIGLQKADKSFMLVGTAFLIGRMSGGLSFGYFVTAKHVIDGIQSKGLEKVFIRVNTKMGSAGLIETELRDWIFPIDATVDLAILPHPINQELDHLLFPERDFLSEEKRQELEVEIGDEVFIAGLFRHHHGESKNLPIVRIGNIAGMPSEKIQTKNHLMDGHLIEARSIGGLSGSPVFTNLGNVRHLNGQIQVCQGKSEHYLFGIIHGHYDSKSSEIDDVSLDVIATEKVNTGIAIVTPVSKLVELLREDKIRQHEEDVLGDRKKDVVVKILI